MQNANRKTHRMKSVLVIILVNLMLCGCGAQTESKSDQYTTIKGLYSFC